MNKKRIYKLTFLLIFIIIILSIIVYFVFFKEKTTFVTSNSNVISYTYEGRTDYLDHFPLKGEPYSVDSIYCSEGSAKWDYDRWGLLITNITGKTTCVVNFKPGNTITMVPESGDISEMIDGVSSVAVAYNGSVNFKTKGDISIVSCSNNVNASLSNDTISVSNIKKDATCVIRKTTLRDKILADNTPLSDANINFSSISSDKGLYFTNTNTQDNKLVYYYRGNVENNYVIFGKDANDNPIYWRIMRINEDASVRLIYAGIDPRFPDDNTKNGLLPASGGIGKLETTSTVDPKNIGYKYGNSGSLAKNRQNANESVMSNYLNEWYKNSILVKTDGINNYDDYVSRTAIYCNNRNLKSGETYSTQNAFYFDTYGRIVIGSSHNPQFKCDAVEDSFSSVNEKAKLLYPIATFTADEAVYAGLIMPTLENTTKYSNSQNYLMQNVPGENDVTSGFIWTMTPYGFYNNYSWNYSVYYGKSGKRSDNKDQNGGIYNWNLVQSFKIRPVLSLKSCVLYTSGNGIIGNPYLVTIDTNCVNKNN